MESACSTTAVQIESESMENTDKKIWTNEAILLLIRLVEGKYDDFNIGLKKNVWMNIAADLSKTLKYTISADQCDSKWKGLKKTCKKIKDLNNTTGNKPTKWEFYYVMDNLLGNKPEVIPQAVCSSSEGLIINKGNWKHINIIFCYYSPRSSINDKGNPNK